MEANFELYNHIHKDANMASYTLDVLLKDLKGKDNKIKDTIEDIKKGYDRYQKDTEKLLKKADVEHEETSFMAKMGASMNIKKEVKDDNSDSSMADMLIKGITMGTIDMEKKISQYQDIADKKAIKLAKEFYQFQKENIDALKKYL